MSPSNGCRFFILAALFILCTTFVVYLPALQNGFVGSWDDNSYVFENSNIKLIDIAFLKWSFTSVVISLWHPLTLFSLALDYAVWGINPLGYHLTNILIHTANTFLVFILVIQLIRHWSSSKLNTKTLIAGTITALLFGIHPLHVESVAWISERKDVLCAFFFLISLLAYLKYATASNSKKPAFYIASLVSFLFALLSKPMAVSLPIVLLILDFYPLNRLKKGMKAQLIEKLPFFLLSALIAIVTVWASHTGGALKPLETYPLMARLFIAACSYILYLLKMALPFNLAPFYPYTVRLNLFIFEHVGSLILLLGITVLCIWLSRRNKLFIAAWLYYLFTLMPVIGFFQVGDQAMANRYTYLPSLGLFILAGLYIGTILESHSKKSTIAIIAIIAIVSGILVNMTIRQITVWSNPISLWMFEIKLFPQAAIAHNNLGLAYYDLKKYQEAIKNLNRAIEIDPRFDDAYNNLGIIYSDLGNYQEAIKNYDKAANLYPLHRDVYLNRCGAYIRIGNYRQAIMDCTEAIKINPLDEAAYYNRGLAHYNLGIYQQALNDLTSAIKINPDDALAHRTISMVYLKLGNYQEAIKAIEQSILIDPTDAKTRLYLKSIYSMTGNLDHTYIHRK